MSYTDKTLTCRDCNASFVFTAGEQEFHAQKGFPRYSPPGAVNCAYSSSVVISHTLFSGSSGVGGHSGLAAILSISLKRHPAKNAPQ